MVLQYSNGKSADEISAFVRFSADIYKGICCFAGQIQYKEMFKSVFA